MMIQCAADAQMPLIPERNFRSLAAVFSEFFLLHAEYYPYTTDFSVWYAESAIFALVTAVALVVYGFYTSLGGQRLFREGLLKE